MKRGVFFLLGLTLLLQVPTASWAECTNIGGFSGFLLGGTNTVILLAGSSPFARFDVLVAASNRHRKFSSSKATYATAMKS